MKTIRVKPNQTLYDIAIENYGTCEAISEILKKNPHICNDKTSLAALGIETTGKVDFYLDAALQVDQELHIDTDKKTILNSVIREINTDVTTYNL